MMLNQDVDDDDDANDNGICGTVCDIWPKVEKLSFNDFSLSTAIDRESRFVFFSINWVRTDCSLSASGKEGGFGVE